jgi:hypothetical protein
MREIRGSFNYFNYRISQNPTSYKLVMLSEAKNLVFLNI